VTDDLERRWQRCLEAELGELTHDFDRTMDDWMRALVSTLLELAGQALPREDWRCVPIVSRPGIPQAQSATA
jgi:hypothetical protein